ncbi:MAG: phosphoribosylformylglycinamidine synthase subunit PurQ [Balneolales bacterium]
MKIGVIVFPGSNCDHDAYHAMKHVMDVETTFIWHKETDLGNVDLVLIPGGFSYGDYLRSGAIARFSPVMGEVIKFAQSGGLVMGICNGFQVLLEAGLLPGTMMYNEHLRFSCKQTWLRCESSNSPFTGQVEKGSLLQIPIAHGEGNYYTDSQTLEKIKDNDQVLFRYADADGNTTQASNPNGSVYNIAGICNESRNVMGMMPHPERAVEAEIGSDHGRIIFESVLSSLKAADINL